MHARDQHADGAESAGREAETPWLTDSEQGVWRAYLRGSRLLTEALEHDLQPHGVSLSEYEILALLSEAPGEGMRMSVLAEIVKVHRDVPADLPDDILGDADRPWSGQRL